MTTDHHAEAERLLSAISTQDWRDEHPYVDRRTNAAKAHALLALDDTLRAILCWEEPPEEVLARVKAETLENPAQDGETPSLADLDLISGEGAAAYLRLALAVQDATDAPEPAQTLADLTPCLGDRVLAAYASGGGVQVVFGYDSELGWSWLTDSGTKAPLAELDHWTVLEHLDPVTPEEPPVGAGMLVDVSPLPRRYVIWNRDESGWRLWVGGAQKWSVPVTWAALMDDGFRFRPATPADLAEHGVDEQGEPVGEGEADTLAVTLERREDDMTAAEARKAARIALGITSDSTATRLLEAYADALDGAR